MDNRWLELAASARRYGVDHITLGPREWESMVYSVSRILPFRSASGADEFRTQALATGEITLDGVRVTRRKTADYEAIKTAAPSPHTPPQHP
jgi:hypothetical protein